MHKPYSSAVIDVAGLLAYLLSIYPSATFDPRVEKDLAPSPLVSFATNPAVSTLYSLARNALPAWFTSLVGVFSVVAAPVTGDYPYLTPLQLKKAIIALSTPDILSDLPTGTVNKLAFNNATESFASKSLFWDLL